MKRKRDYAYRVLQDDILQDIESGTYEIGSMLPTQMELAEKYGVSRLTVREALKELIHRGYIESCPGRGTVVCRRPQMQIFTIKGRVEGFSSGDSEGNHRSKTIAIDRVPASKKIAECLGTEIGAFLVYIKRLRIINDTPVMLDISYLPYDLVKNVDFFTADLNSGSLYELLRCQAGIIFEETREEFRASLATSDVSDLLGIFVGEPIIRSSRYALVRDPMVDRLIVGEYSEHFVRTDAGPITICSKS